MDIRGTLSKRISASVPARFGVALLATLLALLVDRATSALAGSSLPYFTAFAAVAFSTWFCGTGPAVASLVLSLLTVDYWFIPPTHSLRILHTVYRANFLAFLFAAIVIVVIAEANLRCRNRLRNAAGALEEKRQEPKAGLSHTNHSLRQLTPRL